MEKRHKLFCIMGESAAGKDSLTKRLCDELGLKQNSDVDAIKAIVEETINEFPQSVIDFKNGKDRAVGFLVGQVMKKTRGKVNPQITSKLVLEILKSK